MRADVKSEIKWRLKQVSNLENLCSLGKHYAFTSDRSWGTHWTEYEQFYFEK